MKKFLIAAALIVGIVASQLITMPQAEAYTPKEGDQVWRNIYQCVNCGRRGEQIVLNGKIMLKDDCPTAGCPSGEHKWRMIAFIAYMYQNGQWLEITRTYY